MSEPEGRRERAKAEKKAHIIAAATALLDQVGYDNMIMSDVARDADVAIGTVFTYAATKAELLMMVTAHRWQDLVPGLEAFPDVITDDAVFEAYRTASVRIIESSASHPEVNTEIAKELLFGTRGTYHDEVYDLMTSWEHTFSALFGRIGVPDGKCTPAARAMISGGFIAINRIRNGRQDADPMTYMRGLFDIVLDGARAK